MRIGINGCGRIGRVILRQLWQSEVGVCTHLNDVFADVENIVYLIKYDSIYGTFPADIFVTECGEIVIEDARKRWVMSFTHAEYIQSVDWQASMVDVVMEATGLEQNSLELESLLEQQGVSHVVITNTCFQADYTVIHGVNEVGLRPDRHRIISTSICDAGAITPVLKRIEDAIGMEQAFITTLHPWLSYQNVLDGPVRSQSQSFSTYQHYQLGRMSTGALIPKPTTVGMVLEHMLPELKGKIASFSYRVPTATVCSADLSLVLKRSVDTAELVALFAQNSRCVRSTREKLVSPDYIKEEASAVVDLNWLDVTDGKYVKLVLWYDNEWGYTARVIDVLKMISSSTVKAGKSE